MVPLEEIEKLKKSHKKGGKNSLGSKSASLRNPAFLQDPFGPQGDQIESNLGHDNLDEAAADNTSFNIDINEQKEIYQFKLKIFENEESYCMAKCDGRDDCRTGYICDDSLGNTSVCIQDAD